MNPLEGKGKPVLLNSGPKYWGTNFFRTQGDKQKGLREKRKKSTARNLGQRVWGLSQMCVSVCVHMHGIKSKRIYICMLIVSSLGDGIFYFLLFIY